MSQDTTSLDTTIDRLGQRYDELKKRLNTTTSLTQKLDLLDVMELLNIRITRLETLRNHMMAATVVVNPPSAQDKTAIKDALTKLSARVKKDMTWAAAKKVIKAGLRAANTIEGNIRSRQT